MRTGKITWSPLYIAIDLIAVVALTVINNGCDLRSGLPTPCTGYLGRPFKNTSCEMGKVLHSLLANIGGLVYNRCNGYLEHPFKKEIDLGFHDPPLCLCQMILNHRKNRKIILMQK
jgi:hypothetical protein